MNRMIKVWDLVLSIGVIDYTVVDYGEGHVRNEAIVRDGDEIYNLEIDDNPVEWDDAIDIDRLNEYTLYDYDSDCVKHDLSDVIVIS